MLREQRPFKFFKVPVSYMKEFAREAKEHGLLYVPIRNRQKSERIEVVVFADDASKIQRIYDNLGLDYVAAQAGDATMEKAPVQEKQPPAAAAPSRMETVQTEHGAVEFEVGGFEDETATICAIAREQAHAGFDTVGSGYYRQAYAPQAYCAAYVVAQKLGLDTSAFHFDKVCQTCAGMEVQEKKGFISDVKRAAYAINRDMQRSFREMEQTIQPDEFSVESPKPAKAPKAKEDKEKEAAR